MYMNDSILKFMQRPNVVDPLPDQMRGIKVEAKMFTGNSVEHSTPDVRCNREVLSARPFIAAEQHRTIFDPNLDVMICCKRNQWFPNRLEKFPILFQGLDVIPADKCGHNANSQACGCLNHPAKVLDIVFAFDWVSAQGVRVVSKARNTNSIFFGELPRSPGFTLSKRSYIEMRYTGVTSFCFPNRPAHQFYTTE